MKHIKLFEDFNIDIYEHGRCELFALALHEELGYDMYFYYDDEAEIDDDYDTALVHAFAKDKNGILYDATGEIVEKDLDDHAEYVNSSRLEKIDIKEFHELVDSGFISEYNPDDITEIRKYIREHISKYTR
jgi:hypothetical protein